MAPVFDPMIGRYVRLDIDGTPHRLYFEEAGQGIPLVCLHTAGADNRQFRHLLADPEITRRFRVIAFDMPWHGKSTPPDGWEKTEYRLTTASYTAAIRAFCQALELDRPVVMGCSISRLRMAMSSVPWWRSRPRTSSSPGTTRHGCIVPTSTAAKSAPP